jgi:hypothetical protein
MSEKPCPEGKVRNPETKRCRKIKIRLEDKPCPEGKVRDPTTKRCRKTNIFTEAKLKQFNDDLDISEIQHFDDETPDCVLRSKLSLRDYQKSVCKFIKMSIRIKI